MNGEVPPLLLGESGRDGGPLIAYSASIDHLDNMGNIRRQEQRGFGRAYRRGPEGGRNWCTAGELEHCGSD